jgi:hypothetical protein
MIPELVERCLNGFLPEKKKHMWLAKTDGFCVFLEVFLQVNLVH